MTADAHISGRPPDNRLQSEGTLSLLKGVLHEITTLFRQEVALGTAEVVRALKALAARALSVVTGLTVLFAGLLLLLTAAVLALSTVIPPWAAALIIGAVVTIAGGVLTAVGGKGIQRTSIRLPHTAESLRKDKDVLSRNVT
jgi:uncharacterized membrane protein YqjE